ncbi:MAG: pitrilysin family protein [Polyangiales bacterium]
MSAPSRASAPILASSGVARSDALSRAPSPVERVVASNGLRVVVVPQPHLQSATVGIYIKAGPRYERREVNGVSHFLEHMLFRGTERFDNAYELSLAAELLGGTIEAATYADFTQYQISVPSEQAEAGLDLIAELLRKPRFRDLELEKQIVKEEILADLSEDGREVDAENLSRALVYGEHPLGFKITGDVDTVLRLTLDDLHEHLRAHYGASNAVVVATGAVSPEAIAEAASRAFEALPRGQLTVIDAPPPPRHRLGAEERLAFVKNDGSQTELRACFRAFPADDPDYMALKLLLRVLDDGMSTRLHRKMTDDSGLAYEAFAGLDSYEETGLVEVGASVEHEKVPEALAALLALMTELRDAEVTPAELDKARTRYAWTLRSILDSAEDMAMYAGTQVLFGREPALLSLLEECEAVTLESLQRVARRVVRPENVHVVCVGKVTKKLEKAATKVFTSWLERESAQG